MNSFEGEICLVGGEVTESFKRDVPARDQYAAKTERKIKVVFRGRPGEIEVFADVKNSDGTVNDVAQSMSDVHVGTKVAISCIKRSGVKDGKPWSMYEALDVFEGQELAALERAFFGGSAGVSPAGPSLPRKTG